MQQQAYAQLESPVGIASAAEFPDETLPTSSSSISLLSGVKTGRVRAVALFSVCTILLFADQNLMAPNLTAIGNDFGFNDEQRDKKLGGEIAFAFYVLGAPASFVVGCLADTHNRTHLFALTVGIGEGACLATYWTTSYIQLYVCRALSGFSLGGALPLIYSILGDLFAADERHTVSALVGIGTGIGISLGQAVAGFVGPTFGWKLPFLIVSIPSLACALMVWLTVPDPERGRMEQAVRDRRQISRLSSSSSSSAIELTPLEKDGTARESEDDVDIVSGGESRFDMRLHWLAFKSLLSTPTVILALTQGAPGCIPWGLVNTYLNDFLAEDRGMSVERATFVVLVFGLGNFAGMVAGGAGGTYLYRRDKRFPALLAGFSSIAGCLPFWVLLNNIGASSSSWFTILVAVSAGFGSGITGPIIKAELQNVTMPQERGRAFALFNTTDDFGRGLGPVFVAALIANLGGRTPAFDIAVLGWVICGVVNLVIFFTVERDEQNVQARIAASFPKLPGEIDNEEMERASSTRDLRGKLTPRHSLHRRSAT